MDFDDALLARIDTIRSALGLSRDQLIERAIHEQLDRLQGRPASAPGNPVWPPDSQGFAQCREALDTATAVLESQRTLLGEMLRNCDAPQHQAAMRGIGGLAMQAESDLERGFNACYRAWLAYVQAHCLKDQFRAPMASIILPAAQYARLEQLAHETGLTPDAMLLAALWHACHDQEGREAIFEVAATMESVEVVAESEPAWLPPWLNRQPSTQPEAA